MQTVIVQAAIITDYRDTYAVFAYQDREMLFDVDLNKLQQRPKSNLQVTVGAYVVGETVSKSHPYSYLAASKGRHRIGLLHQVKDL